MAHEECLRQGEISSMQTEIGALQQYTTDDKMWKVRMEDKIDKILWFFLGQSLGVITLVIGSVIVYVITK